MEIVHGENIALFEKAKVNGSILKYTFQDIELNHPYSGKERDMTFLVDQDPRYIDLRFCRLKFGIRVVKDDGSDFYLDYTREDGKQPIFNKTSEKNEFAIPIDCIFHTMWSSIQIFYDGKKISGSSTNYAYKSYIDLMLETSAVEKKSILHLIGMANDSDNFDSTNTMSEIPNPGLQTRYRWTRNGKELHMNGPLQLDMCKSNKHFMVNDKNIKVIFEANPEKFRLQMQPPDLKAHIELINPIFRVARVTPTNDTHEAIVMERTKEPLQYPHRLGYVKTMSMNSGERTYKFQNVFNGMIPFKLVVGFVEEEAYSGHPSKNPLKFSNLDCEYAVAMVGSEALPAKGYELDFANGNYADAVENLYNIFSPDGLPVNIGVSREQFKEGVCLLSFDLDPSTPGDLSTWGIPKVGNLDLAFRFRTSLKAHQELIIYGIFPATVELDISGSVTANQLLMQ